MRLCGPGKGAMTMEKKNNGTNDGNPETQKTNAGGEPAQEEKPMTGILGWMNPEEYSFDCMLRMERFQIRWILENPDAEAVGALNHGDVVWIKAVGGIWGEIYLDPEGDPLYLNLNNVVLLRGEAGYDIPIRTVRLVSTLDGLTEIEEGTEVTITAEFSGFMEDEIADITWQYRSVEEEDFRTVDDAAGLVYTYAVTEENIHNEWRIVLTLRS